MRGSFVKSLAQILKEKGMRHESEVLVIQPSEPAVNSPKKQDDWNDYVPLSEEAPPKVNVREVVAEEEVLGESRPKRARVVLDGEREKETPSFSKESVADRPVSKVEEEKQHSHVVSMRNAPVIDVEEFLLKVRSVLQTHPQVGSAKEMEEMLQMTLVEGSLFHRLVMEEISLVSSRTPLDSVFQQQEEVSMLELEAPPPGMIYENGGYKDEVEYGLAIAHYYKSQMSIFATYGVGDNGMLFGRCRNVEEYEKMFRVGEGSHGVVFKARDTKTGETRALKRVKLLPNHGGIPSPAMREISVLSRLCHSNVMKMYGVVVGETPEKVFCVFEYVEHDLSELISRYPDSFSESFMRYVTRQLCSGLRYLHDVAGLMHRDVKPSNVLYSKSGVVKLCDFGLCVTSSGIETHSPHAGTRWYRSPEMMLGVSQYGPAIDIWAVGCIVVEMLSKKPIFKYSSEEDHVKAMRDLLGRPNDSTWADRSMLPLWDRFKFVLEEPRPEQHAITGIISPMSGFGRGFVRRTLSYDPKQRLTAEQCLLDPWLASATMPGQMPEFDEEGRKEFAAKKHEAKKRKKNSQKKKQ